MIQDDPKCSLIKTPTDIAQNVASIDFNLKISLPMSAEKSLVDIDQKLTLPMSANKHHKKKKHCTNVG